MHPQARFALAHPVFDPTTQIVSGHFWRHGKTDLSAGLTVNIGRS